MWVILLLHVIMAQHDCDKDLNGADTDDANDYINADCNFAGICWDTSGDGTNTCNCCDYFADNDIFCQYKVEGVFRGVTCNEVKYWTQVTFGYHIEGDGVTCANDGESSAVPSILNETIKMVGKW